MQILRQLNQYNINALTRHPPRSNNLNILLQSIISQLKPNLIITLASASVRDKLATLTSGNLNLLAGNDGTSKRGAEEVDGFVDGVGLDGGEDEFFDELGFQVLRNA
jgi:hypothetical protein